MKSQGIWNLPCPVKDLLIGLCLSPEEIAEFSRASELGLPSMKGDRTTAARRSLVAACRTESPVAHELTDLLDLRYLDTVNHVRLSSTKEVDEFLSAALRDGIQHKLPSVLWALTLDERREVRALGLGLVMEALTCSYQMLRSAVGCS